VEKMKKIYTRKEWHEGWDMGGWWLKMLKSGGKI
jgi:hypothetical protein